MRRKDKEVTNKKIIESMILRSSICRIALSVDNHPYIVPVCFGYRDNILYFHSFREGKKLDILRKNNRVCVEFDIDHEIVTSDNPCNWAMRYRSVVGFGKASFIEEEDVKRRAIEIIMRHYSDSIVLPQGIGLNNLVLIKVDIESITGRISGYELGMKS